MTASEWRQKVGISAGTDRAIGIMLMGAIAAWTHGWGFWAGLFWQYWVLVKVVQWASG